MARQDDLFTRLWERHASDLLGFLVYRTGDRALAEDVLLDTFERAMTASRRWRGGDDGAKPWLYAIALNRVRDLARREGAEQRALARVGGGSEHFDDLDDADDRDLVRRALAGLPVEEREALALRFGGGLSLREIAEATGEKQTTIEGRVYRGLGRLREQLD